MKSLNLIFTVLIVTCGQLAAQDTVLFDMDVNRLGSITAGDARYKIQADEILIRTGHHWANLKTCISEGKTAPTIRSQPLLTTLLNGDELLLPISMEDGRCGSKQIWLILNSQYALS